MKVVSSRRTGRGLIMDTEARGNSIVAAELVTTGIAAAKAGRTQEAHDLLVRAVAMDERNIQAWLWLSGVVDGLEDKEVCLENVLTLDPDHAAARKGLEFVRRQLETQESLPIPAEEVSEPDPTIPAEETPATVEEPAPEPEGVVAAVVAPLVPEVQEEELIGAEPVVEPVSEQLPARFDDEFDNEYLCPYCAEETSPDDKQCPSCQQNLWVKARRREKLSGWLRFLIVIQAFSTVMLLVGPLFLLYTAATQAEIVNPFTLMPAYLGVSDAVDPAVASAAMTEVPRILLLGAFIPFLFSLLMLIGLMQRWKVMFYLLLITAILSLLSSVVAIVFTAGVGLIPGGMGVLFALALIFIIFQTEDDFFSDERRVLTRVVPSAKNGIDFLNIGQHYMRQQMWGLAAVHLRRAAGRIPEMIDTHLALAAAYMNLKRYDLAARALGNARRVNAEHPSLLELETMLGELTAAVA